MRLFDVDPFLGVKEFISYDHNTDSVTIKRVQDVEPILDRNKALQADMSHWRNQAGNDEIGMDMRLVASIPVVVQERWLREYGVDIHDKDHWEKVKQLLNDPDWRWLKAADVRI